MKNIIILLLLFTGASNLFGQENEDKQGEPFDRISLSELNDLLKYSYAYGHKSLYKKSDSLVHINKNGSRRIRLRDINFNSIRVKKDGEYYRVIVICKGEEKKMIADWGKYNSFGFPLKKKYQAEEFSIKFKNYLTSLGYN